ncbi:putative colanic acid biosynthesis acetyltransferase [uncultured Paraglaciecola sp.]|uniref:putative colanic acid biosynthesis acetyltransferase n=1 Tax=uncultured Paraglaciecola sp. TaxID=1765024 RepID=UPI0030DDD303|tara:strand:- start:5271 stop:5825 length:555 start_codon:yes stop_codon:yes gene_type:complete
MTKLKNKSALNSAVFPLRNKVQRAVWGAVYFFLFRFSPTPLFTFRRFLLSAFGADVHFSARIYPSASIWLPSNLTIEEKATLGPKVNVYNQGKITIGRRTTVSQGAHLCASTHDYNDPLHPLLLAPICIESDVWVCAEAFVGPGVTLSEGSVIGARAVVVKSTAPWSVSAGNPARHIKERTRFN